MRWVRVSSLIVGIMMILQWGFFLLTGNVPELETTPVSIIFHITVELITAVVLISTFFLLRNVSRKKVALAIYAQGMLGYTVINSAGYFAQSRWPLFLLFFALLLFLSVLNLILLAREPLDPSD